MEGSKEEFDIIYMTDLAKTVADSKWTTDHIFLYFHFLIFNLSYYLTIGILI